MTSFKTSTLPNDLQSSLSSNKGKLSDIQGAIEDFKIAINNGNKDEIY